MSDRPEAPDANQEIEIPAPVWIVPSARLTREQLAAAQRTREYHVRKLQRGMAAERSGDAARSER